MRDERRKEREGKERREKICDWGKRHMQVERGGEERRDEIEEM